MQEVALRKLFKGELVFEGTMRNYAVQDRKLLTVIAIKEDSDLELGLL